MSSFSCDNNYQFSFLYDVAFICLIGFRGISEDNLFGFGYGPRRCIGQKVVWTIIDVSHVHSL